MLSLLVVGWARAQRCLVLPFPNRSGDASLDWLGESYVLAMRTALADSAVTVLSDEERGQALAMLGVPAGAELSLASQMRLAKAADARWLIMGWYDYDGAQLTSHASLVDLTQEHLTELAPQAGPLTDLESMQARLGWAALQQMEPGTGVAAPSATIAMPLSAYEDFTRARLARSVAERIRLLLTAARLAPNSGRVLLALGEAYLGDAQAAPALDWLTKVPEGAGERVEAEFYAGVAAYQLGQTQKAADLWRAVSQQLPLPAVVSNLAVAEKALQLAKTDPKADAGRIETSFPADEYRQLARAVGDYAAAKSAAIPADERADYEVRAGDKLRAQGALTAAAAAYQRALAAALPGQNQEQAAAHTGLGEIAYERHDLPQATKEVAAALAAAPGNAAALALRAKLGTDHD